jgi:hypothetical protein
MKSVAHDPDESGFETKMTTTITWDAPRADGLTIQVYGVNRCFAKQDSEPCLVVNTPLPEGSIEFIAKAPASAGKVSWTWPNWENIGGAVIAPPGDRPPYEAVVVAAYGPSGHSKFTIVATSERCDTCTY